jgi:hypothetical protein
LVRSLYIAHMHHFRVRALSGAINQTSGRYRPVEPGGGHRGSVRVRVVFTARQAPSQTGNATHVYMPFLVFVNAFVSFTSVNSLETLPQGPN